MGRELSGLPELGTHVPKRVRSRIESLAGDIPVRVLVVEDEIRLAENVARSLRESAGYAVDVAADGQEGLFLAESNTYDVVLLDLMLPKMDGMQLLTRIRQAGQLTPVLTSGELQLNTVNRTVQRGGRTIMLTAMEYRVLEYLAHRPRAVVSKTELLEHLYDYNWEKFSNVIEVYISGLRRKIDDDEAVKLIHTMRGHGYVLRADSLPSASA